MTPLIAQRVGVRPLKFRTDSWFFLQSCAQALWAAGSHLQRVSGAPMEPWQPELFPVRAGASDPRMLRVNVPPDRCFLAIWCDRVSGLFGDVCAGSGGEPRIIIRAPLLSLSLERVRRPLPGFRAIRVVSGFRSRVSPGSCAGEVCSVEDILGIGLVVPILPSVTRAFTRPTTATDRGQLGQVRTFAFSAVLVRLAPRQTGSMRFFQRLLKMGTRAGVKLEVCPLTLGKGCDFQGLRATCLATSDPAVAFVDVFDHNFTVRVELRRPDSNPLPVDQMSVGMVSARSATLTSGP